VGESLCSCIVTEDGLVEFVCHLHQMMILANDEILHRWMYGEVEQRLRMMFDKLRRGYVSQTEVTKFSTVRSR